MNDSADRYAIFLAIKAIRSRDQSLAIRLLVELALTNDVDLNRFESKVREDIVYLSN